MNRREDFRHTYVRESARNIRPHDDDKSIVAGFVIAVIAIFIAAAALALTEVKIYIDKQNAKIERSLY